MARAPTPTAADVRKAAGHLAGGTLAQKPASRNGGPKPVTVSMGKAAFKIDGVRRRSMDALFETLSRGAAKGRMTGEAEFTVRIGRDGTLDVSEIRTPVIEPERGPAETPTVITARPEENEAAFARARERGRHRVAEILDRPEMLSADAFGRRVGLSRVAINDRRQRRELLGLEGTKRGFKYPEWQIGDDGQPLDALPKLFAVLGDSSWAVYRFLMQTHAELNGRSALSVLQEGRSDPVLDAAESVARGDFA